MISNSKRQKRTIAIIVALVTVVTLMAAHVVAATINLDSPTSFPVDI